MGTEKILSLNDGPAMVDLPNRRWSRVRCAAVMMAALAVGTCSSPTQPELPPALPLKLPELPAEVALDAFAEGQAEGLTIKCKLEFVATIHPEGDAMRGIMGGGAERTALNPDGSGVGFIGDAYYPDIRITVLSDGRATITSYTNGVPSSTPGGSPFWRELNSFEGVYDEESHTITGGWTCRPMRSHGDMKGKVTGTWTLHVRGTALTGSGRVDGPRVGMVRDDSTSPPHIERSVRISRTPDPFVR